MAQNRFQRTVRRFRERFAQRRLRARGWYDPAARSDARGIIIGGCGRSGTTVFKEMLNRHPRIACGPETSMFGLPFDPRRIAIYWNIPLEQLTALMDESEHLPRFAERFYGDFVRREGKARWADKTPNNVRAVGRILTWFPRARFIHVIRDGRDVVCSLRHHPKERIRGGRIVPVNTVNTIEFCCRRWVQDTSAGLAYANHPRCFELRYEHLIADPEGVLRRVCDFLGEDYDPAMLDPSRTKHETPTGQVLNNPGASSAVVGRSIGRWRRDLTPDERAEFVDRAGELLIALGYAEDHGWVNQ